MTTETNRYWDLLINDRNGKPTLIVEVKSKIHTSPDWAAGLRYNLLSHGYIPHVPYFLLAFPDKFYLWTNSQNDLEPRKPDYIIEAHLILQPYLKQAEISKNVTKRGITEQSLELILASWLGEIVYLEKSPQDLDKSEHWLIDSGLYDALIGGNIEQEAAA